jgi:fermentation-respiration switch protein FrsA (DUF1100 family)
MHRMVVVLASAILSFDMVLVCRGQESVEAKPSFGSKATSIDELLLFFPSKFPNGNWNPRDLRFQDVFFAAEDKTKLHGWFCPARNQRAVLLMAHGNAGNITSRTPWLRYLQTRAEVSVFIFDYRGYGRSEGTPTVEGAVQDAFAARAKLCELTDVKESEMLLMGESLGGAIVLQLASKSPPQGLILQSTFSSLRDVAEVHYPNLAWLVSKNKLDSMAHVAAYRGPLLQSHGTMDETIPILLGRKLFRAANEPKTFVSIANADHNNWLTDEYLKQLNAFLNQVVVVPK